VRQIITVMMKPSLNVSEQAMYLERYCFGLGVSCERFWIWMDGLDLYISNDFLNVIIFIYNNVMVLS